MDQKRQNCLKVLISAEITDNNLIKVDYGTQGL
jgi:hypothetical protein